MQTTVIAEYHTRTGAIALAVYRMESSGGVSYRYDGKVGAGCARTLGEIKTRVLPALARRRGLRAVQPLEHATQE